MGRKASGKADKVPVYTCRRCGERFFTNRPRAVYCTSSCKVMACLARSAAMRVALTMPEKSNADIKAKLEAFKDAASI